MLLGEVMSLKKLFSLSVAEDVVWLVFLGRHMAAGAADSGLALEHYAGGSLRPHRPPHRLCWPGPAGRPADGGGQPGPKVCSEHEARQTAMLRPRTRRVQKIPHFHIFSFKLY